MADIKYGSSSAGFSDAIARMKAQQGAIESLEKKVGELEGVEQQATGATRGSIATRISAAEAIQRQVAALSEITAAMRQETGLLGSNTAAWRANAIARAEAAAASAAPTVGARAVAAESAALASARYAATQVASKAPPTPEPVLIQRPATTFAAQAPLFHGTDRPPEEVATSGLPKGAYLASAQRDAEDYGRYIYEVRAKGLKLAQDQSDRLQDYYQAPRGVAPARVTPVPTLAERPGIAYGASTVGFKDAIERMEASGKAAAAELEQKATELASAQAAIAQRLIAKPPPIPPYLYKEPQGALPAGEQRLLPPGPPAYPPGYYLGQPGALRLGEQGLSGPFVGGPGGLPEATGTRTGSVRFRGEEFETAKLGEYTAAEEKLIATNRAVEASLAGLAGEQRAVNAAFNLSIAEYAASSQALSRHGALSTEFIQAFARGEVTLREFGTALTSTIGKFGGWAIAGAAVYGAYEAIKTLGRGAGETATQIAQLERAQLPDFNRERAAEGLREVSARVNVPIREVGEAQFYAARAGFNKSQAESLSAGETAILAQKLDLVPIQDAARGLGAVRVAFGLNATQIRQVFNELDVGQLKFNARLQQTLPYLGRASSAFAEAGGTVQQLVRQIVLVTGAVPGGGGGGGSGSAATFFTREPGNLRKPSSEDILRLYGFDPREPIGLLNEAIQQAVKRGVAPAGQKLEPVIPGQAQELRPGQQATFRIAEALSGGPALAGRYGIQLVAGGVRQEQINRELSHAEGAAGEDLKHKLEQFNEQALKIGRTFERIGSELESAGLIQVFEGLIGVSVFAEGAVEKLLEPLGALGKALDALPGPVKEALVIGGLAAVATRVAGSEKLAGVRGALGEAPGAGFFASSDKAFLNDAKRTFSEGSAFTKTQIESASRTNIANAQAAKQAKDVQAAYAAQVAPQLRPAAEGGLPELSAGRAEINKQIAANEVASNAAELKSVASRKQLVALQVQYLDLQDLENIVNSRLLTTTQKKLAIAEANAAVSGRGTGRVEGPEAAVGSRAEAEAARAARTGETAVAATAVGGALGKTAEGINVEGAAVAGSLGKVAGGIAGGGVATQAALEKIAAATQAGSVGVAETFAAARARIAAGGNEVFEGLSLLATGIAAGAPAITGLANIGAASRGVGSGLGEIGAGAALGLGAPFGGITKAGLFKGLTTAFFGVIAAEIVGEQLGLGKQVENLGKTTAVGAGIGQIFGKPFVGAAAGLGFGVAQQGGGVGGALGGALAGGAIGALLPGGPFTTIGGAAVGGVLGGLGVLEGSGSPADRAAKIRTEALRLEKKRIEEGQSQRDASIEATQYELGKQIEASIKDETEAAVKAKESVTKQLKTFAAQIHVFGPTSEEGKEAATNLAGAVAQEYQGIFRTGTQNVAKAAQQFDEGLAVIERTTAERLKAELPYSAPGAPTAAILNDALTQFSKLRTTKREEFAKAQKEAEEAETKQATLTDQHEAEVRREQAGYERPGAYGKAGLSPTEAHAKAVQVLATSSTKQALDAATRDAESKRREAGKQQADQAQADLLISAAEKAAVIPPAKEAFTAGLKAARTPAERQGALASYNQVLDSIYGRAAEEIKQPEQEAKALTEKKKNLEGSLALASYERSPAAGRIEAAIAAVNGQLDGVNSTIKAFRNLLPGLDKRFRELEKESAAFEAFQVGLSATETKGKLSLFNTGGNRGAERKTRAQTEAEEQKLLDQLRHETAPGSPTREQGELKVREKQAGAARERLEEVKQDASLHISEIPRSQKGARAQAEADAAQKELAVVQRAAGEHKATSKEVTDAQIRANDALNAAGETVESEQKAIIQATGALERARAYGNARAQAGIAQREAGELLAVAKTPSERIQAQARVVEAANQAQQAAQTHIADLGALAESREPNPAEKAATKIDTIKKQLPGATHDEKIKLHAQLNDEIRTYHADQANEQIAEIDYLDKTRQINSSQAVERLRKVKATLEREHAPKSEIRSINEKIFDLLNAENFELNVGNVARPTLYGATNLRDKAVSAVKHAITNVTGDLPRVLSQYAQPQTGGPHIDFNAIHHPPQLHQVNHIQVNVAGGHGAGERVAAELERHFHVGTKSLLRSARLAG